MKRKKSTLNRSNYWNKLVHKFYNLNNKIKKLLKNNASEQEVSIQLSRLQNLYKKLDRLQHKVGITIAGTALALMLTTTNANAQDFKYQGNLMGTEETNVQSGFIVGFPEFYDLDEDGDLDLYLGGQNKIKVYKNDGANNFQETNPVTTDKGSNVSGYISLFGFGDIDGDGDMDLLASDYYFMYLFKNEEGSYVYDDTLRTSNGDILFGGYYPDPEFVDLDDDGDMDLVTGNFNGYLYTFLNDGDGNLSSNGMLQADGSTIHPSGSLFGKFADMDNDGDMDLIANEDNYLVYYQNDNGSFSLSDTLKNNGTPIQCFSSAMADLDGDADLDIYAAVYGGYVLEYKNDGTNNFNDPENLQAIQAEEFYLFSIPTISNIDEDGSLELYVGAYHHIFEYNQNNDFDFSFTDTLSIDGTTLPDITNGPSYADIDNDGSLELINNTGYLFVYDIDENLNYSLVDTLKDDNGDFVIARKFTHAAFADFDNNLNMFVNYNYYILRYTIESGVAIFTDTLKTTDGNPIMDRYANLSFGDIDLDGDTDLLFGNVYGQLFVYTNDGTDQFDLTDTLKADGGIIDVPYLAVPNLIDIDDDGDLDLVLGEYVNGNASVYFYRNDDIFVSTKEIPTQSVLVYPNPTSGLINIENTLNYSIDVYNVNGQIVRTYKNINNDRQTIDLSNEQKGVYIIKLYNDQEVRTAKIILK